MIKRIWVCSLALLLMIAFGGCKKEEPVPKGVIKGYGDDSYVVQLPDGKSVNDYFALTGDMGYMHITTIGQTNMNYSMSGANYSQVSEGGWVIYGGDVFMYIPEDVPLYTAQTACSTLARNSENYMSLEEAKQYISFLSD